MYRHAYAADSSMRELNTACKKNINQFSNYADHTRGPVKSTKPGACCPGSEK